MAEESRQSANKNEDEQVDDSALVDELGVQDLQELIFGKRGRLFSTAGRDSPVAEFTTEFLVLHPPQKPFEESESPLHEDIIIHIDECGILRDDLGYKKKIAGARFNGQEIYYLGERKPNTLKHYAAWFDEQGRAHKILYKNEPITTEIIFRLRNRTHDGELSIFAELSSEEFDDIETKNESDTKSESDSTSEP